jgi:hypothetical protein
LLSPNKTFSRATETTFSNDASTSLSGTLQLPLQHERKIRNVDLIMFWFVSQGSGPIKKPLQSGIRFADLYLHLHGESEVQIWIWNNDGAWQAVEQGFVHPHLPDRRLWLPSRDEPSWITRKTARTYKGKHVKDQES